MSQVISEIRPRLSASQISCIFRCPREYAFNYIEHVPQPKSEALHFGSQFHEALNDKAWNISELEASDPDYPWSDALNVCLDGFMQATRSWYPAIAKEHWVETEDTILIVDQIGGEIQNGWWLTEFKTAGRLDENKRLLLPSEIQCLMYMGSLKEIADSLWLDPADCRGLRYTTTVKPAERRKKTESKEAFAKRLTSETHIWEYRADEFASAKQKKDGLMSYARKLQTEIHGLYDAAHDPRLLPASTANCARWGQPCPYFFRCHNVCPDGAIPPEKMEGAV